MPAKKNSSAQNNDESSEIADSLGEGEKIIIQDTRTIQKQTVPGAASAQQSKVIELEPDDDEPFDVDDLPFSENSLAALLTSDGDDVENEFCTVQIRREPDNFGDKFLNPQSSRLSLAPMRNVELSKDRSEIEEIVREENGGGHYFFQIHYAGRLRASWKNSLADSPAAVAKAKAENQNANPSASSTQTATTAAAPVNPFDQFFETLEKQKKMKDLLFGDEMKELERLREQVRQKQTDSDRPPENEKLAILQYADKIQSEEIRNKVLGFVFGEESSGGILDTAKFIFDNDDKLIGIGGKLLNLVTGGGAPVEPNDLEAMLRQEAPQQNPGNVAPPAPRSNFRRQPKPEQKTLKKGRAKNE